MESPLQEPLTRRTGILVLDGEQRAALAVARSLVRAGHRVHVATRQRLAPAAWSRGTHPVAIPADPLTAPEAFAHQVAAAARREGIEVVLPVTDASVQAMLESRAALADFVLPIGDLAQHRRGADKVAIHALAAPLGLGVPGSVVLAHRGAPIPTAAHFPGVIKPHRSVVGDGATRTRVGVQLVDDAAAARRALEALPDAAFPVLLQPRVRGPGSGVFALRWNGQLRAWFAHRRLREKPPAGGVSVYCESIALEPALHDACAALLASLEWQGVAMLELKRDAARGAWCVMELNGRFWGSLQLAIDAGVDFPTLLVDAALGAPAAPPPAWRIGTRLRWEWGEVDHLMLRLLRSRERLQLPPDAPTRLGALGGFFAHRPGRDHLELLRASDPLPALAESLGRLLPH